MLKTNGLAINDVEFSCCTICVLRNNSRKMNTASPTTGEKIGQEKQGTDKAVTNEAPKETPKKKNTSKETSNKRNKQRNR